MKQVMILVHWYGPYAIDDICDESFGRKGLYLFTGKAKYKNKLGIPYCGITEDYFCYYLKRHNQTKNITRELRIWLGYIAFPGNFSRKHLEHAESAVVYYMQTDLNIRKKRNPPDPIILISFWFKPDETPRINQPHPIRSLPDVICYDGDLWRTSNLRLFRE